jgi:orotidine-5'-phosphate decarboxylase
MFNVHASGGSEMMKHCADAVVKLCLKHDLRRPRIMGVTVLTSMSGETLREEIAVAHGLDTQVKSLAKLAKRAGLDGVVASAREARFIKEACGPQFLVVTPGIRPTWAAKDDQQRIVTPRDAFRAGADYIVVGRAVTSHPSPATAMERLKSELDALNAPPHP